ncbi:MAG: very short patch repair endonuclease [Hyphomicrobiales bacterium]
MASIKGKNTKPEIIVRKAFHAAGFRFRLHDRKLPGKPDIVLPKYRTVVFVHGCFWHGHECEKFRWPKSRKTFWRKKIEGNRERDDKAMKQLRIEGWRTLTVWECALKGPIRLTLATLTTRCATWLMSGKSRGTLRGKT